MKLSIQSPQEPDLQSTSLTSPPHSLSSTCSYYSQSQKSGFHLPAGSCVFHALGPALHTSFSQVNPAVVQVSPQMSTLPFASALRPLPSLPQYSEHSSSIYASLLPSRSEDSSEQGHRIFIPSSGLAPCLAPKGH